MTKARHILFLLSLVAGPTKLANCQQILQCSVPSTRPGATDDDFVQPKSAEETAKFKQAPHGAKRLEAHVIEVGWARGKRIFKDKPPYDEPLDGLRWTYCSYNADLKLHMLLKEDEALFTGALVDEVPGSSCRAGKKCCSQGTHNITWLTNSRMARMGRQSSSTGATAHCFGKATTAFSHRTEKMCWQTLRACTGTIKTGPKRSHA
jgi:hypothetical protein